jgi:catechol 2,3-dioxygenase-like lactoylglutathione lyase family enzyme
MKSVKEVIGGVRIVTFIVSDLDKARAFYVDKLGFRVEREEPGRSVMVNAGSFRLSIDKEDADNAARGGGSTLIFMVRSLGAAEKELEERGVPFAKKKGTRTGPCLETRDPEGYGLVFTEKIF